MSQATTLLREYQGQELPFPGIYDIDKSHTTVEFVGRHLMITKVRGRFEEFSGTIEIGEDPADSRAEVTIDTSSVSTGDQRRDGHLTGPDFLDVEHHPTMTYKSTGLEPGKGGNWKLIGDLTVRGVTRPVTLDVEFDGATTSPWGDERIAFTASADVDREDWGLTWNQTLEAGGVLVGKKVRIELNVQAIRRQ
jgi:polyisoprenoid-binding protein YceI